jgi:predicted metal-dependent phosphoesterase TrpH
MRPASDFLALCALAAFAAAAGPAVAQRLPSETSLRFWRLHQADNPFRDPDWIWQREDREIGGRYGARNAREAYALLGTRASEADTDLEPQRLERKLLLAAPLMGQGNLLPLVLEPSASLGVVLAERVVLGKRVRRIDPPPGFVAIDTHVHTCFSPDSVADPALVLRTAARRGLAGIAITDHDTIDGARRAQAVAQHLKAQGKLPASFVVIEGEEVGSREGHIIALFLHTTIPADMSAAATVDAIHAQGGLAIAAHPELPSGVGRLSATLPFDAVETINMAEELHFSLESGQGNRKRSAFYDGLGGAHLGVSDAHDPSAVGLGYTLIPGTVVDEATVRRALANRETQPCRMPDEQRLQRLVRRFPRPAIPGLRFAQRGLGWGSRLLKGLTGADQAQIHPRLSGHGIGLSLSLEKRF